MEKERKGEGMEKERKGEGKEKERKWGVEMNDIKMAVYIKERLAFHLVELNLINMFGGKHEKN